MKNIAKKSLLLGAFALLLSTVPVQAMEEEVMVAETASMPADVQQEIQTRQGWLSRLSERFRNIDLKQNMKNLNRAWNPFIKCVEKGEKSCEQEARNVSFYIKRIIAAIAVGGAITGLGFAAKKVFGGREAAPTSVSPATTASIVALATEFVKDPSKRRREMIAAINESTDETALSDAHTIIKNEWPTEIILPKIITQIDKIKKEQ